tara:strand:+ start:272 stop:1339 length:1068 start_codon:yes stop_codon:yes gene_type:complete
MKKIILRVVLGFFTVFFVTLGVLFLLPPSTPEIEIDGVVPANCINEIRKVEIGTVDQYLLIRGHDRSNPVLLFIHGGPGQSEIGYIRRYQENLEEDFVVVRWDQRGAGLSKINDDSYDSLSLELFMSDTDEVTDYLRESFSSDKVVLAGHSWGSVLGLLSAYAHPEKYHMYFGIGQFVQGGTSEDIGYDFVLKQAENEGNEEALKELKAIGPPPYSGVDEVSIQRRWLALLGGVFHSEPEVSMMNIMKSLFLSPEYDLSTKLKYNSRIMASIEVMLDEVWAVDFLDDVHSLEIPFFFFAGKYDYATPSSLVKQLFDQIEAPLKEFVLFEDSAHLPQVEETERFNAEVKRVVFKVL